MDVETTGLSLSEDRIIEINMVKEKPDGSIEQYGFFLFYSRPAPKMLSVHHQHDLPYSSLTDYL